MASSSHEALVATAGQCSTTVAERPSPVVITAVRVEAMLSVRSWNPANRGPCVNAGKSLPTEVGATASGPTRALCLAPAEWLIASQEIDAARLRAEIGRDLSAQNLVAVDLTSGLASFHVNGPVARHLLSKGCGLDFHPRSFPAQRCARTRFAQLATVIECREDPSQFELHVGRSYAAFLRDWLLDAAREFGA